MEESEPFIEKGKKEYVIPKLLSTVFGRVVSLVVVFICCVLASGPLSGFPTLQPLLEEAGVFQGRNQGSLMSLVIHFVFKSIYNFIVVHSFTIRCHPLLFFHWFALRSPRYVPSILAY
jgi:hypothetical protein